MALHEDAAIAALGDAERGALVLVGGAVGLPALLTGLRVYAGGELGGRHRATRGRAGSAAARTAVPLTAGTVSFTVFSPRALAACMLRRPASFQLPPRGIGPPVASGFLRVLSNQSFSEGRCIILADVPARPATLRCPHLAPQRGEVDRM